MNYKDQLIQIIASCLEVNPSTIDCRKELFEMDGYDSMRSVMILSKIEDYFDLLIPEDDIFDITTVDDWAREIEKLKG